MDLRGATRILAGLALLPTASWAADVDLFQPAGSLSTGRGSPQAESASLGITGFSGGILAGLSRRPVVRRGLDGTMEGAVESLVPIHLHGAWTQAGLLRIDVQAPVYALVDAPIADFQGPAVGDLRLQAAIPLLARSEAVGLTLLPRVELPTGSDRALVSNGLSAGLVAALGGQAGRLGWIANAGVHIASNEPLEPTAPGLGSRAMLVGGAWWQFTDVVRMGLETDFGIGLASGDGGTNNHGMVHGFAQAVLKGGLGFSLGGGTGVLAGVGVPQFRVFGGLTWTAIRRDQDADGVVDDDDQCPDEAEDLDSFDDADGCPDPDNDQDGLADSADLCPNEGEDLDEFEDTDGCPDPDNDQDGLVDVEDQCPGEVGTAATLGCPDTDADGVIDPADRCPGVFGLTAFQGCADQDGDGIPDPEDACPTEPRPVDEALSASDGCPRAVFVTDREIKLDQRVKFDEGKSTIKKASLTLLDQVAEILLRTPHVRSIEVQGHTDNVGSANFNLKLSQARAEAVATYLQSKGVASDRLVAQGYGESTPRFTNRTPKGRESNRRVQFIVLDVEAPGADGNADAEF